WMVTFRRLMALPMFATAVALAWVLGRQAGVAGMTMGIAAAAFLAAALWWVGLRQHGGRSARVPAAVAALSLAALLWTAPGGGTRVDGAAVTASLPNTQPFSEA